MGLHKGMTNNPNGRPKGSPNKITSTLREMVSDLLSENYKSIIDDIKQLEPKERVDAWIKLLEYGLPKLQRMEAKIDISSLTLEEVEQLIDIIISNDE